MRKLFYLFMACMMLGACEVHMSENGDLDGFWQMTQIDTLATGTQTDVREKGIYYAVYVHMLQLSGVSEGVKFRFEHTADSLILSSPTIGGGHNDIAMTDMAVLRLYGINRLPESFHVDKLTGDRMILTSSELRLYFRKY